MGIVIDCNFFPPDREELKLALRRAFKFVINKEKKTGNEIGRKTKLFVFDLDTGKDKIEDYFQKRLFGGEIHAYHALLTLENPPFDNDHDDYNRIKLFLDYLDKNQLGRKISYFDCVKDLSELLNKEQLEMPVKTTYWNAKEMFYDAVKVTFRSNNETQTKKIIKWFEHKGIKSDDPPDDPPEIFFQANQGNEMGSDLNDHKMLRSLAQALQEFFPKYYSKNSETLQLDDKKHPLNIAYKNRFVTLCRDMGANIVEDVFNWTNKTRGSYRQFKVLIIDDNYKPFENEIEVIESKTKLKFFRLENEKSWNELYDSLNSYNQASTEDTTNLFVDFWRRNTLKVNQIAQKQKQNFAKLKRKINSIKIKPMSGAVYSNYLLLEKFDFFLVDLQFGEQKIGDRMVRYLKRLLEDHEKRSPILILSLSDDSMDIQRCLNEGARGYIYKERIFSIPYRLKELYEEKTSSPSAAHSQNFRSLYQLPHPIIDRLKREQITGNKIDHEWIDHEYEWIDCLPKADLHVHLGGSMPADLIADLAFNHLLNMVYQKVESAKGKTFDANEIDKALEEIKINELAKINDEHIQFPEKQLHSVDKRVVEEIKGIIEKIENQEETTMPFPNRKICDVAGNTSLLKKFLDSEEFGIRDLTWDHKLCIFLVSLAYKDGYDPSRRWRKDGFYYKLIDKVVREHYLTEKNIYQYSKNKKGKIERSFNKYLENKFDKILIRIKNMFNGIGIGRKRDNPVYDVYDPHHHDPNGCCQMIREILNARNKNSSLIGYLRGCEISGAQLLRSFENIIIAAFRIGLEASLNRVRYMELRCSPDGFVLPHTRKDANNSSLKFFMSKELDKLIFDIGIPGRYKEEDSRKLKRKRGRYYQVLDALLWGFGNKFQNCSIQMAFEHLGQKEEEKKNFIAPRITILISAKRHKNMGKIKDQIQMYQMYKKRFSERAEYYAPILGFDLAGAEKGFPPSVFSDVMTPLFEKCINMTIHAGEETDWLYIWQSIYKLHAARIGHGLTLGKDLDLLQLAKERKICIEMCPISNTLTNKYSKDFHEDFHSNKTNYEQLLGNTRNDIRLHGCLREEGYERIRKILFSEKRSKKPPYPLRFYYDFGLPVAICTDNPCISNASMTEEYMEACRRSGGFSKWDILRIIKTGFKNAFLPKEEVARMLQRVGNEIYDKVLELEKIERPYRPSSG